MDYKYHPELNILIVQMFPYKTALTLDKALKEALYLQLANQFIVLISDGKLAPGTKLISSRELAELLKVHRKTIIAAYDELILQGWIETIPKKGTFVNTNIPIQNHQLNKKETQEVLNVKAGFSFYENKKLHKKEEKLEKDILYINDGTSDTRLTPVNEIGKIYRRIASKNNISSYLNYGSTYGNQTLREVLVAYLNLTRGLHITINNILITRGSQMGIWLSSQLLLKKDDVIVVGETNYNSADVTFLHQKAHIKRVAVDENGINITEIETLCKQKKIKAVYVTSHHHHPTTVTLSAERRIHLLNLAKKYNFAILEDDYDYDFNYNHAPIFPLASHDNNGNVVYTGSVCKTVAPVFRIGYLIGSKDFIEEAAKLRGYVDRQGDALLELTFAEFIKSGALDRHIRKVMKVYKQRRDLFCQLLKQELDEFFSFEIPKGGMAAWVTLHKNYSWKQVREEALRHQLEIGDYTRYDKANVKHNAIRIGFAAYNETEVYEVVNRLKKTVYSIKNLL